MKKYYKLLATAWMAIRPLFPCFAANTDKIQWGSISNYFNFSTITEEEKRTNLETNIRLLIEEQLKLPSGQNLWKAFQFWEEQHQGLAFRFKFSLNSSSGASVVLKNMEKSPDGKQVFCFEIAINEVFAEFNEDYFTDIDNSKNFLNINMLYRPCLIKLVDPDDPDSWEYHLREQELPFFITLAHEFLHALNQLERIAWILESLGIRTVEELFEELILCNFNFNNFIFRRLCLFNKSKINQQNLSDFQKQLKQDYNNYLTKEISLAVLFETVFPIQDFLAKKLNLKNNKEFLQPKYKSLWQNGTNDDSLDEMTVILGSERKINCNKTAFIGETTFLQEYYNNDTIISWSHYSAYELRFWENMENLLMDEYVSQILTNRQFCPRTAKVKLFYIDKSLDISYENFKYKNSQNYLIIRQTLEEASKTMIRCKKNCIFSLKNAKNNTKEKIELVEIIKTKEKNIYLLPKCYRSIKLENYQIVDLMQTDMKALRKYSIEDIDLIAKKFNIPMVIISENNLENNLLQYQCFIYTINKQIKKVNIDGVERILNLYPDTLKLYYNGIQFYKIVKNQ